MEKQPNHEEKKSWLKRLGWAGFFFFLIKGILWLVLGKGLMDLIW